MRVMNVHANGQAQFTKLTLSLASTSKEIKEVQRLRYKVFIDSLGLTNLENSAGLDKDEFDEYCDHLIVRESHSLRVVGTYRVLSPTGAQKIGRHYAEAEFDLSRIQHLKRRMAEAGRACVHPDFRNSTVLMMLWSGLAAYVRKEKCDYIIGCSSISLADGGHNAAAVYQELIQTRQMPNEYRVAPHLAFPIDEMEKHKPARIPTLLNAYMKAGAWVGGEPAWDTDFHCADIFLLLSIKEMNQRFARRLGLQAKLN